MAILHTFRPTVMFTIRRSLANDELARLDGALAEAVHGAVEDATDLTVITAERRAERMVDVLCYPALTASEMGTIVYWLERAIAEQRQPTGRGAERIEAALAKVRAAGVGDPPEHTAAPAETVAE